MHWRHMATLEEQHIELQLKQEELENRSRQNNVFIPGVPKGEEGTSIMAYTAALLHSVGGGDPLRPLSCPDRVHRVAAVPSCPKATQIALLEYIIS
ncbi:hypothetical protein NDU88_000192 [Pleurodeles waltl]|uniref:Uncharacterized protein n=1 Tax=Pleurodeles waltl TaxID=8319 RepID=A0AAV7TEU4_PLEWA|nr:hypothetical protein NDU88_000192 [Pleurodeles waltl]